MVPMAATANIEPVARAMCERELRAWTHVPSSEIPALVERYWPVIAAQINGGLRDDDGSLRKHSIPEGIAAWEDWLDNHERG